MRSYLRDAALQGQRFTLASPANSVKLWATYQSPGERWNIGGGVHWQTKTEAFLTFLGGNTGARRLTIAVNLNNMFDKLYYERVNGTGFGNFYGAPRNDLLTARLHY